MTGPRIIPSLDHLLQRDTIRALEREYGRAATVDALRLEADQLRAQLGESTTLESTAVSDAELATAHLEQAARARLTRTFASSPRRVINATGVILHTNLGRAPLAPSVVAPLVDAATGYVALEYDIERGQRGARDTHLDGLLSQLTGAEAAAVVNNNAAATLLLLSALAVGREVIVSRGELVEIGGGFRVPDVMAQSGARLREVGTTNKTRAADYAAAISERTAMLLRVHPSNFRIDGFTERPALGELVALGRRFGITVAEDLGSGYLASAPSNTPQRIAEPTVHASVAAGADIVCFSGDKLLGGPQAGILVGRREWIQRIRIHPLMRALRVDKLTYAALGATLRAHAAGQALEIPVIRMLHLDAESIGRRAKAIADQIQSSAIRAVVVDGESAVGGGSAPGADIPTRLLALTHTAKRPDAMDAALRGADPPVIARIERDRLVLDLRTVFPEQDDLLVRALRAALG